LNCRHFTSYSDYTSSFHLQNNAELRTRQSKRWTLWYMWRLIIYHDASVLTSSQYGTRIKPVWVLPIGGAWWLSGCVWCGTGA